MGLAATCLISFEIRYLFQIYILIRDLLIVGWLLCSIIININVKTFYIESIWALAKVKYHLDVENSATHARKLYTLCCVWLSYVWFRNSINPITTPLNLELKCAKGYTYLKGIVIKHDYG